MKRIFIDIETLPTAEENRWFAERRVFEKWRKQDVAGDENDFARAVEDEFRGFALRGTTGRLLCIGLIVEDNGTAVCEGVFGQDKTTGEFHLDETKTLRQFWNYLQKLDFASDRDRIVGHNIAKFDLPFLYHRSMARGVRPSINFFAGKPWESPVFDTFEEWKIGRCADWTSLAELAFAFSLNCPKSDEANGSRIYDLFRVGRHAEIREYCLRDVRCAREVFYRMNYLAPPVCASAETLALAA